MHVRGDVHETRDGIRAWMEAVQPPEARGRHMVANTRFTDVGEHEVSCVSDFVFFARTPEGGWRPSASGRYADQWTDREGPWRLEERRIEM